jgi:hypothetical protein
MHGVVSGSADGDGVKAQPAKRLKAGQAAKQAVRAAAKQRRQEKASIAKEDDNAWGPLDEKGREVAQRELGESDSEVKYEELEAGPYLPKVHAMKAAHLLKRCLADPSCTSVPSEGGEQRLALLTKQSKG